MAVRKEKTFRVQHPFAQTFEIAHAALVSMGAVIQQIYPAQGMLVAMTGTSLQSFGEIISVQVMATAQNESDVHVESASAVATTMFDWGKNQQNLNAFEMMVAQFAAQLPAMPHQTPVGYPVDSDYDPLQDLEDVPDEESTAEMRAQGSAPVPAPVAEQKPEQQAQSNAHKVFVSYRRSDSIDICGRIYDRLVRDFGEPNVFKDVDNIPFGVDFVEYLDNKVKECTVLLAVIGPTWVTVTDEKGRSRLNDPNDFVRIEIEAALKRNILVVPVLVAGAEMPYFDDLPESLRPLTRRNGISIRPDPDFHTDMTRLIKRLG